MNNYLSQKNYKTKINRFNSSWEQILFGVPQERHREKLVHFWLIQVVPKRTGLEIFLVLSKKKMYLVHERTKGRPKLLFLYLFNLFSFTIAYFHLYYIGIFPLSTGLVRTFYDYMRYPVHLWLSYGSLVTHLGKLV